VARADARLDDAERMLREAHRRAPRDAETCLTLASVLGATGQHDAAVVVLENMAKHHLKDERPLYDAAKHLRTRGRWSDAARALERAFRRSSPDFAQAAHLADVYERLGRLDDALRVWLTFAVTHPNRVPPKLRAARLALALDRVEAAAQLLKDARALEPHAPVGEVYVAEGFERRALPFLREALR
ncbi:MAG: tetratricopeptide repeat protein, partial [Myxococcota bacterium]